MPPRTYEVTFTGQAGTILRAEFDDCEISVGPGTTTLHLELADQGALHGLLQRIASFGLELTDVSVVAPADVRQETSKCRQAQFTSANRMATEVPLDELGPVDYLVVEFPTGASSFTSEMAAELRALTDAGTIRVIDVLILTKDADGAVEATELSDIAKLGELQVLETELGELLAGDDVRAPRGGDGAGKHGRGAHLGEPVGSALGVSGAAFGRPAGRRRADSHSGDHRLDPGRRGNCD